ncbi:MAG: succinate dehydrogenase cytochrome b subunit [Crocinitomicaceae bacterium]|nr:succinate dehydrogenase cytochrome b subunit [Crocinitomicaceae bacterium]
MSKSAILSSSVAKKWWMALTGLFLCLFLVGHLLGNLQLIAIPGVEGKRAFNEYAHFMTTNPLVKILSYLTYISVLFHAIDGVLITIHNKKSRPVKYVYKNPHNNIPWYSRSMAVLGSLILIFIVLHMSHFWWKMKHSSIPMPVHKEFIAKPQMSPYGGIQDTLVSYYYTTKGDYVPADEVKVDYSNKKPEFYVNYQKYDENYKASGTEMKIGEGYKDLHSLVCAFFGQDKMKEAGIAANSNALVAVIIYVLSMMVLGFHLMHGFSSAFQSLGINHRKYNKLIKVVGKAFAIIVPTLFAIIPIVIYLTR